ncbi:RNA-dependent RNA polymerase [Penicillium citrinum ourmia-like virus 1]|uniref:RNA-dependent RNA polymerase n=1 Tax=Penicillium citrinum ourmia-like virus 1 TaxID=2485924 RepID=A0A3G3C4M1_9VIRU|nr:RNA-dependent RNA polymerase [Penicillium citrinum ourmia-like virus 1]AYP71797.1 RNA-dependent RNA polymerase [Penicillium citrinum ourmia-like virus 1]
MVTACDTPAFCGAGRVASLFSETVSVLLAAAPDGVRFEVPDCLREKTFSPPDAKKFCVGLLENPEAHPWWPEVRGLTASHRMSIAGSLFLFRKCLPSTGKANELRSQHRERLCTSPSQANLPAGYVSHCRRIARECFPPGWDSQYADLAWGATPSVKSCRQAPRSKGGPRSLGLDRSQFLRDCLREGRDDLDVSRDVDFLVVRENGKDRMVTRSDASTGVLRPLHKALYNRLSRLPWLLRGEATPGKFKDFTPVQGEIFVSGDYEAATDFLPIEVARAVLEVALANSKWIPSRLGRAAVASLNAKIHYEDCELPFDQVVGQLMGNLLSFPLLCVQNYCAFRWIFPDSVPVKINGDDIVFRTTQDRFEEWARFVSQVGLRLSVGKTMTSPRFFSVNSSFFRSNRRGKPSLVPVLRVASLSKPLDSVSGLGQALRRFCLGFVGAQRQRAETMFLRKRAWSIRSTGRSVIRGLGMKVSVGALQESGLWRRECWYAELQRENPLPEDPSRLRWAGVPDGWRRELLPRPRGRRSRRSWLARREELESAFVRELVDSAWRGGAPSSGVQKKEYFSSVAGTGYEESYRQWVSDRKKCLRKPLYRFMRSPTIRPPSTKGGPVVRRWIENGVPSSDPGVGVGYVACDEKVWVPVPEEPEDPHDWVDFVPWESRFCGSSYEQFILGARSESAASRTHEAR